MRRQEARVWGLPAGWSTPASDYPAGKRGRTRVRRSRQPAGMYHHYGLPVPGWGEADYYRAAAAFPLRVLEVDGKTWMVDDPPHWHAMLDHATHYGGRVLCAGLGLGLIVHALDGVEAVSEVVVVERDPDVIALVTPLLPGRKLRVVEGDWEDVPARRALGRFDGVFYDLFVGEGARLLGEAVRQSIHLRQEHPGAACRRIHGFDNAALAALVAGS